MSYGSHDQGGAILCSLRLRPIDLGAGVEFQTIVLNVPHHASDVRPEILR